MKHISLEDNKTLWGKEIYGPIIIVDPITRVFFTNLQDGGNSLMDAGHGVFTGVLPDSIGVANTSFVWNEVRWTMLIWNSLSRKETKRNRLIIHELFHSLQNELGFPMKSTLNGHLETKEGRILFLLELSALRSALTASGSERGEIVRDAIFIRKQRNNLFNGSGINEDALEMNEGLAEFTGVYLSGINNKENVYLLNQLDSATVNYPTFTRSFAYLTGPAYGILFHQQDSLWTHSLSGQDNFEQIAERIFQIPLAKLPERELGRIEDHYNGKSIRIAEEGHQRKKEKQLQEIDFKFKKSKVLVIPYTKDATGGFDPTEIIVLSSEETYYKGLELIDAFGKLVVDNGAIRDQSRNEVHVNLPSGANLSRNSITSNDWNLTLNSGWTITKKSKGIYEVTHR
ncbi:MAG: hypothetical protein ABL895_17065 [Cyclobacteriaceae bacterium]